MTSFRAYDQGLCRTHLDEKVGDKVAPAVESCTVKSHTPPRFQLPQQETEMLAYLDEHGYCVVASVASDAQIATAHADFWTYLGTTGADLLLRDDPAKRKLWLPNARNGILGSGSFNHSPFCWNTRLLPGVKRAFASIWGTDDLICSFDGSNAFRPWQRESAWLTEGGWWHVDQNATRPHRSGRVCVQGLVSYRDATVDTGGLCVIPGSHRDHDALCARSPSTKMQIDFVTVEKSDPILAAGGVLVECLAGDLVLWDSRTVHCNTPALTAPSFFSLPAAQQAEMAAAIPPEVIRLVGYVCMVPAAYADAEVLKGKVTMFQYQMPTSHWPTQPCPYQPDGPPPVSLDACSPEQLALVGYREASTCSLQ